MTTGNESFSVIHDSKTRNPSNNESSYDLTGSDMPWSETMNPKKDAKTGTGDKCNPVTGPTDF